MPTEIRHWIKLSIPVQSPPDGPGAPYVSRHRSTPAADWYTVRTRSPGRDSALGRIGGGGGGGERRRREQVSGSTCSPAQPGGRAALLPDPDRNAGRPGRPDLVVASSPDGPGPRPTFRLTVLRPLINVANYFATRLSARRLPSVCPSVPRPSTRRQERRSCSSLVIWWCKGGSRGATGP